ncbi:MAG: hypothetical protein HOE90_20945 [Bacteriovoracaceae bacterium]|jgi:pimeloyl-ACP methyl ester carboxylesterase|nr:hypothetical protein [Bacteriovoracaceae bacterium]
MEVTKTILFINLIIWTSLAGAADAYKVVSEQADKIFDEKIYHVQTTIQQGEKEINRFTMNYFRAASGDKKGQAVLLVGGSNSNSDVYSIGANPLVKDLASQGYAVYGYSPRTKGLSLGFCQKEAKKCDEMKNWGLKTYLSDIELMAQKIKAESGLAPVLVGMSLGSILSFKALAAHPNYYAGVVFIDGNSYSTDEKFKKGFETDCLNATKAIASGEYYDTSMLGFKLMANLFVNNPGGKSPVVNGLTNYQAFFVATNNPVPNAFPGYTYVAMGDTPFSYKYSPVENLLDMVEVVNELEPMKLIQDYSCEIARGVKNYKRDYAVINIPVLGIAAEKGFGAFMQESIIEMGAKDKSFILKPGYAHADLLTADDQRSALNDDIINWLKKRF